MIIGITGKIGSGKDTAADYLCTVHGFKRMSFAGTLKDAVSAVFNWDRELLEGSTKTSREWRETVDQWWADRLGIPNLTPRWILQQWGTDVCRKSFHNDIWVASVENRLLVTKDDIVITDCRFPNEINAIQAAGGITMRTNRGGTYIWEQFAAKFNNSTDEEERNHLKLILEKEYEVHASEYSSVGLEYDCQIDNNGTIDELHNQIAAILNNQPAGLHASKSLLYA
jgi:hypothetical protein